MVMIDMAPGERIPQNELRFLMTISNDIFCVQHAPTNNPPSSLFTIYSHCLNSSPLILFPYKQSGHISPQRSACSYSRHAARSRTECIRSCRHELQQRARHPSRDVVACALSGNDTLETSTACQSWVCFCMCQNVLRSLQ